jgi:phosphatidylglycerol:prolipoprotein diacylglycerol transferase
MMGLGAAAGLAWSAWRSPARLARPVLDAGLASLVGGILGGRAGEVLLNWAYYRHHPGEVLQLQLGGLEWPGALLGALLVLGLYAAWIHQPFGLLADRLLPLLAFCTTAAWLGCWLVGCAYGYYVPAPWGLPALGEGGVRTTRFPLQLTGALLALLTIWAVQKLGRRTAGESFWIGLAVYAAGWLALSFLRASPVLILARLPWDAWAALFILLLATGMLLARFLRLHLDGRHKNHPETPTLST